MKSIIETEVFSSGLKYLENSTVSPSVPEVLFEEKSLRAFSASISVISPSRKVCSSSLKVGTALELKKTSLSQALSAVDTCDL